LNSRAVILMHISQTCIIVNTGSLNLLPHTCCAITYKATIWCNPKLQCFSSYCSDSPHNVMSIYLVTEEEIEVYIPVQYQAWSPPSLPCRRCVTSTGLLVTPKGCRSMGNSMSLSSKPHSRMASYSACSVSLTPR